MFNYKQIRFEIYKTAGLLKYSETLYKQILYYLPEAFDFFKKTKKSDFRFFNIPKDLYPKLNQFEFPPVGVVFNFFDDNDSSRNYGQIIDDFSKRIKYEITLNIYYQDNKIALEKTKETIKHELIHLTQLLFKLINKSNIKERYLPENFIKYLESLPKTNEVLLALNEVNEIKDESDYSESTTKLLNNYFIKNKIKILSPNFTYNSPKEFDYKKYEKLHNTNEINYHNDPAEFFTQINDIKEQYIARGDFSKEFFNKLINVSSDTDDFDFDDDLIFDMHSLLSNNKYNKKLYDRALKELYKIYLENNK